MLELLYAVPRLYSNNILIKILKQDSTSMVQDTYHLSQWAIENMYFK